MSTSKNRNKRPRIDHDLDVHFPEGFITTKSSSSKTAKPAIQVPQFASAFDSDAPTAISRGSSSKTAQNVQIGDIGQSSSTRPAGSSTRPASAFGSGTGNKVMKEKKLVSMSIQNPQNQFALEKRAAEKSTSSSSSEPPQRQLRASVPPRALQHPQPLPGVLNAPTPKAEGGSGALKLLPAPAFPVPTDKHASNASLRPLPVPKPPSKSSKPKSALFPAHAPPPPLPKQALSSAKDAHARAPASAFLPKQEEPQGSSQDAGAVFGIPARSERDGIVPPHKHHHPEFRLTSNRGLAGFGDGGTDTLTNANLHIRERGLELSPDKRGKGNSSKFIRGGLAARAAEHFSSTHTALVLWHKSLTAASTSNSRTAALPPADLTARIVKVIHAPLPTSSDRNAKMKSAHIAPGIALCRISFAGASSSKGKGRESIYHKEVDDALFLETHIRPDHVYRVVFNFPPASLSSTSQEGLFVKGATVRVYRPWTTLVVSSSTSAEAPTNLHLVAGQAGGVGIGSDKAQGSDVNVNEDSGESKDNHMDANVGDAYMHSPTRSLMHLQPRLLQPFPEMPLSLPMSSSPHDADNEVKVEAPEEVRDLILFCTRFLVIGEGHTLKKKLQRN